MAKKTLPLIPFFAFAGMCPFFGIHALAVDTPSAARGATGAEESLISPQNSTGWLTEVGFIFRGNTATLIGPTFGYQITTSGAIGLKSAMPLAELSTLGLAYEELFYRHAFNAGTNQVYLEPGFALRLAGDNTNHDYVLNLGFSHKMGKQVSIGFSAGLSLTSQENISGPRLGYTRLIPQFAMGAGISF